MASPFHVFAVEPTAVQITWRGLGPGRHHLAVGPHGRTIDGPTGAAVFDHLPPGRLLDVVADGARVATTQTLVPPPGRLLGRFATMSDLHIGEQTLGFFPRLHSSADDQQAHPMRALRAALAEAKAWGAERLVVKGDITDASDPARLALALRTMGATELPLHLVPGNHDHRSDRRDPADVIIGLGHAVAAPVGHTDLPGIRLILADSSVSSRAAGSVAAWRHDVLDLAAEAPGAVMLAIHHQLMHLPLATYIPAGIPARESRPFLAELGRANPNTFVTSGHTHRHRRRDWGPIVTTEVGSTKDYPGTWAGYLVYEGGIVQTVRRIMAPDVMEWTERTRQIGFGAWGRWSPGRDEHRSFAHAWVARPITLGPTRSVTGARASGSVAVGPDVVDDLVALER